MLYVNYSSIELKKKKHIIFIPISIFLISGTVRPANERPLSLQTTKSRVSVNEVDLDMTENSV